MLPTEKCFNGCELEVGLSHISLLHKIALFILHVRWIDEPQCAPLGGSSGGNRVFGNMGSVQLWVLARRLRRRKRKAVFCARSCAGKYPLCSSLSLSLLHVLWQMMSKYTDLEGNDEDLKSETGIKLQPSSSRVSAFSRHARLPAPPPLTGHSKGSCEETAVIP